jgi:hypothetical protein
MVCLRQPRRSPIAQKVFYYFVDFAFLHFLSWINSLSKMSCSRMVFKKCELREEQQASGLDASENKSACFSMLFSLSSISHTQYTSYLTIEPPRAFARLHDFFWKRAAPIESVNSQSWMKSS